VQEEVAAEAEASAKDATGSLKGPIPSPGKLKKEKKRKQKKRKLKKENRSSL
jgi:hypothetical protein